MASISNLFVDQGSDFTITVSLTDAADSALNLSNNTFLAQVRKSHGSNTVKSTFATANDGVGGNLTLTLTDVQTAALAPGRQVYDIILTDPSGIKERVVEGMALIRDGVT